MSKRRNPFSPDPTVFRAESIDTVAAPLEASEPPSAVAHAPDFTQRLATIRSRLAEIAADRHLVEQAPAPRIECERRIDRWIAERAEQFAPAMSRFCGAKDDSSEFSLLAPPLSALARDTDATRLESLLCKVAPDAIRATLRQALDASRFARGVAYTEAERRARLDALAAEQATLEVDEEKLVRQAARAGIQLLRRPDADMGLVLGDVGDEAA